MSAETLLEWRNVSDALDDAAAQLGLGELLHGDDFALQRTMTAVVVGSDRMDTGSREETEDPYHLATTDAASVMDFTPQQKLGLMDKLLTLQASYHEGTGLGRSVYTCLLLFDLDRCRCIGSTTAAERVPYIDYGKRMPCYSSFAHCLLFPVQR